MSLTVPSRSRAFRAMSLFMAATMTYSASAAGLNVLALGAVELGSQILRGQSPHFTERPTKVFRGDNPRRDSLRTSWWTPKLQRDLEKAEFSREIDQAVERGEVYASIDPAGLLPLLLGQAQGGGSGSGGVAPGEEEGPAGGSGSGGGTAAGGTVPIGGGLSGETNTNTGNKLTTLPIAGWSSRGDSAVGFTLYHNSIGTYNSALGQGWSHSYDVSIAYTPGSSAIIRMADGLQVPYTESSGTFAPPTGWYPNLVKNGVIPPGAVLIRDDDLPGQYWYDKGNNIGGEIEAKGTPYNPLTTNSNAFLYTILKRAGLLDEWLGSGHSGDISSSSWTVAPGGAVWAPGWGTVLPR